MNTPVTIAMILCGIVGTAGVAAASAATQDEAAPSLVVKYDSGSLLTDTGAHAVYRKIVNAAEEVCPITPGSRLLSESVRQCRAQSIARAVMKINNSRLAAIHDSASRSG
ncbi:MAG: UrcA family protein [Steroidobacteraceae bacterium]|jgi:UrcA family protein